MGRRHAPSALCASALTAFALLGAGCDGEAPNAPRGAPASRAEPTSKPPSPVSTPPSAAADAPAAPAAATKIVFLGDSLTAGFGLSAEEAYPTLVEKLLIERGRAVEVVNAGISGDTSAGGLARLDWQLAQKPAIVFVCLGGNDGLRGLPLEATEANLRAIVVRAQSAGARVVLAGMQLPPNYGPEYTAGFRAIFPRLARELGVTLVPFLLEGVAADPALNQADGIHPNAKGQEIVAETVAKALEPLVARALTGAG